MYTENKLWIAMSDKPLYLLPKMANRHGLVAGATGTGKTITLKVMAEAFSDAGVPVFLSDIKGDLSGMSQPGVDSESMQKRIQKFGLNSFSYKGYPSRYWDIYGEKGHPVRTTISEMGPLLLARIMGLNETQSTILDIIFRVADEQKLLLLDMKDLKAMIQYVRDTAKELKAEYGNIPSQSIGAILRSVLSLEDCGGDAFFGEPALDIRDFIQTNNEGKGYINVLHCVKLFQNPTLYSTFLLWLLSDLYEILPEAGDIQKPKMVFFFDEAHLLFKDAPKVLLDKVEQVVRLIRSKGVGIYFISQSPTDMPDAVLGQLGNRVQHALRAYSPADQKSVKVAAQTFRANPAFDTAEVITQLGIGEALVSFMEEDGTPGIVERAFILPPQSLMGPVEDTVRNQYMNEGTMGIKYDEAIDRESAYEKIAKRHQEEEKEAQEERDREAKEKQRLEKEKERNAKERKAYSSNGRKRKSSIEKMADSAVNTIGREVGRNLIRGILGVLKR